VGRAGLEPATNGLKEAAGNFSALETIHYGAENAVRMKVCKKWGISEKANLRS